MNELQDVCVAHERGEKRQMTERQDVRVAHDPDGERQMIGAAPPRLAGRTLDGARRELRAWLGVRGKGDETDYLVCHALGKNRAWLYANGHLCLEPDSEQHLRDIVARRARGVPFAYLTGVREFYSLDFEVGPAVLVPRPETEVLVECALDGLPRGAEVLDLGTGCGNLIVAIAHTRRDVRATATDTSREALAVARRNAARHGLHNIRFLESDWFGNVDGRFDLIVGNPPYIGDNDPQLDDEVAAHEPGAALFAGGDGLAHLRQITAHARNHLKPGGRLIVEHAPMQDAAVRAMMHTAGFAPVHSARDAAGRPRACIGAGARPNQQTINGSSCST